MSLPLRRHAARPDTALMRVSMRQRRKTSMATAALIELPAEVAEEAPSRTRRLEPAATIE